MWIVIIIALILLLKSAMTSHKAAAVSTHTIYISSCDSSGDNFTGGGTTVAGVPEPSIPLAPRQFHCNIAIAHFPVNPPPIAIQVPKIARPVSPPNPPMYCGIPPFVRCDAFQYGGGGGGGASKSMAAPSCCGYF